MPDTENHYYRKIIDALEGNTPDLRNIPPDRFDWAGMRAALEIYRSTSNQDRTDMIVAMGEIIDNAENISPDIVAQVVALVTMLDLTQLRSKIVNLSKKPIASEGWLRSEIDKFLAYKNPNQQSYHPERSLERERFARPLDRDHFVEQDHPFAMLESEFAFSSLPIRTREWFLMHWYRSTLGRLWHNKFFPKTSEHSLRERTS